MLNKLSYLSKKENTHMKTLYSDSIFSTDMIQIKVFITVVDPGFPRRGRQQQRDCVNLLFREQQPNATSSED